MIHINKLRKVNILYKTINVRLDADKWEIFKKLSKLNNSDASKEFRKFIDLYIKNKGFVS